MKIVTVLGARPQFIKASAVSREIVKHKEIKEIIVHTGQHYDNNMSDIFFEEMNIPEPDYFLDINCLNHGAMTGQMLKKIEEVLMKEKPALVLVYGDTNSTLAGALAAKKLHVRVAHVEAGLRSFNMKMPEEINRTVTDRISDILFCPTDNAVQNLKKEGFNNLDCKIVKSGDVMYDAVIYYAGMSEQKSNIIKSLQQKNKKLTPENFILCTIHREENTDNPERLISILQALTEISIDIPVVLPIHPRTKNKLQDLDFDFNAIDTNLLILDPVGYFDMLALLKNCKLVMTDSGGLQKEAYFFEKICLTLRDETEWIELVMSGMNMIVGADKEKIIEGFAIGMDIKPDFSGHFYGDGKARETIVNSICAAFPV